MFSKASRPVPLIHPLIHPHAGIIGGIAAYIVCKLFTYQLFSFQQSWPGTGSCLLALAPAPWLKCTRKHNAPLASSGGGCSQPCLLHAAGEAAHRLRAIAPPLTLLLRCEPVQAFVLDVLDVHALPRLELRHG